MCAKSLNCLYTVRNNIYSSQIDWLIGISIKSRVMLLKLNETTYEVARLKN